MGSLIFFFDFGAAAETPAVANYGGRVGLRELLSGKVGIIEYMTGKVRLRG